MKKLSALTALVAVITLLIGVPSAQVFAEGTETLGPASITIASGTGIVAAGTGMKTQPGTISVDVPTGASVNQVLLYWSGGTLAPDDPGDKSGFPRW